MIREDVKNSASSQMQSSEMPWPTRVNLNFFPVAKRVDSILKITGQRILATSAKTIRDSDYPYSFGRMASPHGIRSNSSDSPFCGPTSI